MFVRVTFSSVDPRYLKNSLLYKKKKKEKILIAILFSSSKMQFCEKKKRERKESKFETISLDVRIYIYIRIVILPSYIYAIVARMHFLFSSLDVKAIFNIVIIAARQIHYIVEKCNPNTK